MSSKAEPNVVPLCDVLLVLLIIFMVITPLVQRGMDVKLPDTAAPGSTETPLGLIVLTLHKDLSVDINNQKYDMRTLSDALRQLYASRADKTIFIRAEAKLPFYRVMELFDIAKGAGADVLAIIPELIEEGR